MICPHIRIIPYCHLYDLHLMHPSWGEWFDHQFLMLLQVGPRLSRSWIHFAEFLRTIGLTCAQELWLFPQPSTSWLLCSAVFCIHLVTASLPAKSHRKNYNQAVAKSLVKWWSPLANSPSGFRPLRWHCHLAPTRGCWKPIRSLHPPMLEGWYQSFLVKLGMVYEVYGAICHIFPNPICWSKIWCLPPKWSQILQRELGRSSSIAGAFAKCWALVAFLFEGAHDPRVTNIEPHFRLLPNRTFPTK